MGAVEWEQGEELASGDSCGFLAFVFVDHWHFPSYAEGFRGDFDAWCCLSSFVFGVSDSSVRVFNSFSWVTATR
jgi:hypothetical protein